MSEIVIADDPSTMRKVIVRSLRQAELEVGEIVEAASGLIAPEQRTKTTDHIPVTDVERSGRNRRDPVHGVRACKDASAGPIETATNESGRKSMQETADYGADDCVPKPCAPATIREAVSKIG